MKDEATLPTCPFCGNYMEEKRTVGRYIKQSCLICKYSSKIGYSTALREEAIINGVFDEEI